MEGQFEPGQRLTISSIAEQYGTSITPVREAIFRLVSERALEVRAATSVQVPLFSPTDIREVQRIRIELEGLAAYQATEHATSDQIHLLEKLNDAFITAAATDSQRASQANREFHFAIFRIAGMPILEAICENMWVLMGPFLRTFHQRIPARQLASEDHKHYDVINAMKRRDAEAARTALQDDIRWGEVLVKALEEELEAQDTKR